jgi:hypothetical protein
VLLSLLSNVVTAVRNQLTNENTDEIADDNESSDVADGDL